MTPYASRRCHARFSDIISSLVCVIVIGGGYVNLVLVLALRVG